MADNVTFTNGANSTPPDATIIAADDVGGVKYQVVKLDQGSDGASSPVTDIATDAKLDDAITELKVLNSLVPAAYDYIALSYTGSNLTGVVFKTGGAGGSTVSTLTLAYTGSQLDSVTQS